MRITLEILFQSARQFVTQQVRYNRRIVCVYLVGSLRTDEPQLGGTTDIDLFFIHDSDPPQEREILQFSDDVHFDIAHLSQSVFRQPRDLRTTPWLAPTLCSGAICLHDTQHWFEFTQASVCAQFDRPDYRLERARWFANQARQGWMNLKTGSVEEEAQKLMVFLKSLEQAANAIVSLNSAPLTERRFLLQYPRLAESIGRPGLAAGFTDIIMPQPIPSDTWSIWMQDWEAALLAAGSKENAPARLHPLRLDYYKKGVTALRDDNPAAALWPMLRTWTLAVMTDSSPDLQEKWKSAVQFLDLDPTQMEDSIRALDFYLDNIEETLDLWGGNMGL
jgi:hypothetical protein